MKLEGLREIMELAEGGGRNLSDQSRKGGFVEVSLNGEGLKSNTAAGSNLTTTYDPQTIGSYSPHGSQSTHFSFPSQLPSIHNSNPTSKTFSDA